MRSIPLQEAERHLAELVEQAARGDGFVIARDGRPLVRVLPVAPAATAPRLGFMAGAVQVPEDFDRMGEAEIADLFE